MMNIVNMAYEIIELAEERDYWKRQAKHYKEMYEMWAEHSNKMSQGHVEIIGTVFTALLDENSGINKMHRAMERDPLHGELHK
jgi:hypothetical protein